MTFIRPLAIHNIVIPAGVTMPHKMAALFFLWSGVSTLYSASLAAQFTVGSVGAGDFSFMLSRIGQPNSPQYNVRNAAVNQAAAPSAFAYIGINPDGALDPILDSVNPSGPANFSGTFGAQCFQSQGWQDLYIFEFDDAIWIASHNGAFTLTATAVHFGKILVPRWDDDLDGEGGIFLTRCDGLGCLGSEPIYSGGANVDAWFGSTQNVESFWRLSAGTSLARALSSSWCQYPIWQPQISSLRLNGFTNFGASVLTRFSPLDGTLHQGPIVGELKYVRWLTQSQAINVYQKAGIKYLMCFHTVAGSTGNYWIPTTAVYDPLTPGTYT